MLRLIFSVCSGAGNYFFAWQAGVGDGSARTFNVHMEYDDTDSDGVVDAADDTFDGTAFFGYGDDISTTDGSISGMYCNWAGPSGGAGNITSNRSDLVQRQQIEYNSTTGVYEVVYTIDTDSDSVYDASYISYAPTNNCDYDGAGSFQYDSTGDGTIDTSASTAVTNNLIDPADTTDGISASNYVLPTAPAGL